MRILVFQHIECEHPGMLRTCLSEHDLAWDVVQLDQGQVIPDLNTYDALWVMGGPMDVWDVHIRCAGKQVFALLENLLEQ
jgi:hypothetical protein